MAINTGVNITKAVGYAVISVPVSGSGVNASKVVGFTVLQRPYGVEMTKVLAFAVLAGVNPPVWTGTGFPNGSLNVAYSAGVAVSGTVPITFTLQTGSLPTGLSISGSGLVVTLSGTPTALGTFNFTLRASNAYGHADQAFTVVILAAAGGGSFISMA